MTFDPRVPPLPRDLAVKMPGTLRSVPEDFIVEEIPAYAPSGSGEHRMLLVEKRGVTTHTAAARLAAHLQIGGRDVGIAGIKDRHALTRQWMTIPARAASRLDSFACEGVRVLEAHAHGNKLRTGHLRGNRFTITVRGVPMDAATTARRVLERVTSEGLPNGFGPQRFGARGDNHVLGAALVAEDAAAFVGQVATPRPEIETPRVVEARRLLAAGDYAGAARAFPRDFEVEHQLATALARNGGDAAAAVRSLPRRPAEFLVSAWQSAAFNVVLAARLAIPELLLSGDIAMKHENGACFRVPDPAVELPRAKALEISATGPLPGAEAMSPEAEALAVEQQALASFGLPPIATGNPFPGSRRALRVPVKDASATMTDDGHLRLVFTLPRGAFATSLLGLLGLLDGADIEGD